MLHCSPYPRLPFCLLVTQTSARVSTTAVPEREYAPQHTTKKGSQQLDRLYLLLRSAVGIEGVFVLGDDVQHNKYRNEFTPQPPLAGLTADTVDISRLGAWDTLKHDSNLPIHQPVVFTMQDASLPAGSAPLPSPRNPPEKRSASQGTMAPAQIRATSERTRSDNSQVSHHGMRVLYSESPYLLYRCVHCPSVVMWYL